MHLCAALFAPHPAKNLNRHTRKPKHFQFFLILLQNFAAPSVFDLTQIKILTSPAPRLDSSEGGMNRLSSQQHSKGEDIMMTKKALGLMIGALLSGALIGGEAA